MAASPGLLFWLFVLCPTWRVLGQPDPSTGRRFSKHKLCMDEECSMLMYVGVALEDFTGPDCRFVNFKKGDPVYVYYKLAEASPELWAGSVGRSFGYFPRDLIKLTHGYASVEELQVPADETDFVCFDSGRDDFDNYNVEELLGYLEFYDSADEYSEKAIEKASQQVEEFPEVSQNSELEPEPVVANSEQSENAFSENTKDLEKHFLAQKNHPLANSQTDNAQGEQASFEPFEEMLQDKLKVTESENNKTSNSSQVANEQEKIDAYKLLKKEMTLDLKTKFGSTADALVSDDETTRLVTSLEDDFDEEMETDYYAFEKEEGENEDSIDELPLLTLIGEEDMKTPVESGVETYSTDKEQNSNEEDKVEITLPPGIKKDDKNILTTLEDANSNSEEEKEDDGALDPDRKQRKPQAETDYIDPESGEYGLFVETSKTDNDKEPEVDLEPHIIGKERDDQEPQKGSLPADQKGKDTLKPAFENEKDDLKEAVIHISKESLHEEKPGEKILEDSLENKSVHKPVGSLMTEKKSKPESLGIATLLGENQHNASKESMEEAGSKSIPTLNIDSVEHRREEFKEGLGLKTQNQPRFSSPDGIGLLTEPEEVVPSPGKNFSWQQERDVVATVRQVNEKMGLSKEEGKEDFSAAELVQHKATQGTQEVEKTEQTDRAEVPGLHTERPTVEKDDYPPEELLEDENAASAKQSKEKHSGIQTRPDVNQQILKKPILGTINPDPKAKENDQAINRILQILKISETTSKRVDRMDKEPGSLEVGKEESPLEDEEAQGLFEGSDFPDKKNTQTPGISEVFQDKDSGNLKQDYSKKHRNTSGSAEKARGNEISKEDHEGIEQIKDTKSQGPASTHLEDDLFPQSSHTALEPELSDHEEDLPIISSFFKDQESLQRFLKYFDVYELEAMLQEMSLKLKLAQRESLPYNVERILDKVFRSSESHILTIAEQMLDNRVNENRNLDMKESNVFEEAAVLDDIQDLIYFVRYKYLTVEESVPLTTAPPLEEEMQPPHEDDFPQENTEHLDMDFPDGPLPLSQYISVDVGVSKVSQNPNTEKDSELFTTESTPIYATDTEKQLETKAEEPASATLLKRAILMIYSIMLCFTKMLFATLPNDIQPGPDFYGLPWKPVVLTISLGIVSFIIFFWRTILVVKERVYQVTEQQISEKLKNFMKENEELVQKLSNYEQKVKESKKHVQETKKQNEILSDEAIKYKDKIKQLEETTAILDDRAKGLHVLLESEREQNVKNQDLIMENKKSIEKLKDVISVNASEFSEVQIALNEAKLSEEKVKSECRRLQEENARLRKKKDQLQEEVKDWSKSHAELTEQIKSFEKSQKDFEVALTHKDDNINALTNCITQLNRIQCESESEDQNGGGDESDELANGEVAGDRHDKMKDQIKQLMDVSRTQTAISVVEEDLKLLQHKLRASMSTKCSLEDQIKKLEDDRNSLQSAKAGLEDECQTLRQKVEILNELYQQKEMVLQKKLSQEEYERQEKEQRLSAADEKVVLAAEEVKTYKRRIKEMEEELQKTERSFKNQIATHEKKAHDNWLKARAAERAIAEEKREAANLRHKLLEMTQKMAMRQDEPVIVKPMPGRPNTQNPPRRGPPSQNGSFGPSPVSGGECSPPLTAEPTGRPLSATLSRRDMPRSEFGSLDGSLLRPRWSSEASGKPIASDPGCGPAPMNSSSRSSSPAKVMDDGKQTIPQEPEAPSVPTVTSLAEHPVAVNMAKGPPPPFPEVPLMGSPVGRPPPPPIRYGPPFQLGGPFGPRPFPPPFPPPFGPGMRPPLGLREYAPGVPTGKRDLPFDPREFVPGPPPFRPLGPFGPREYFIPGTRLPPPTHGPQDYGPPPAARDIMPSSFRDEPPPASQSSEDCPQPLKKGP